MTRFLFCRVAASALAAVAAASPSPAAAQLAVFDTTNYAQNALQAARALEQIRNQVQSLQNEAGMLEAMTRNLKKMDFPQLQEMVSALRQVDGLMNEAQSISFKSGQVDAAFDAMFPKGLEHALSTDRRASEARDRRDGAMDGIRRAMNIQAEIVAAIQADSGTLRGLAERSQGAVGALQAQQAANQLLALSAKQQAQLQTLLAAEFRSQAFERARRLQAEADARAASTRFLGNGKAASRTRD